MIKTVQKIESTILNRARNSLICYVPKKQTSFMENLNLELGKTTGKEDNLICKGKNNPKDYFNSVSKNSNKSDKNKNLLGLISFVSSKSIREFKNKRVSSLNENDKKYRKNSLKYLKTNRHKWISEDNLILNKRFNHYGKSLIEKLSIEMKCEKELNSSSKNELNEIEKRKDKDRDIKRSVITKHKFFLSDSNFKIEKTRIENNLSMETIVDSFNFSKKKFILNHEGYFIQIFSLFLKLIIFYRILIYPLMLIFYFKHTVYIYFESILELVHLVEIVMNFFITFRDEKDQLTFSHQKLFINYMLGWFTLDIVTSIPLNLLKLIFFEEETTKKLNTYIFNLSFIDWLKILKIIKYFLQNKFESSRDFLFNTPLRIWTFLLFFIIFLHISSCFFIFIAKNTISDVNWVKSFEIGETFFDEYISSLYFHIVTIYSIGYGDIIPVNLFERIYVILLLIIGNILYSYFISSLSTIFSNNTKNYDVYNSKIDILDKINDEYYLPKKFYNKLKTTIKKSLRYNKKEKYNLIKILPNSLKNQLILIVSNKIISKNAFFSSKNNDFIFYVLPLLKYHEFGNGEILISEGDCFEEMYIVQKGSLGLNLGIHFQNQPIWKLDKTSYFGDIFLKFNKVSPFEIKSIKQRSEIFMLKREDYLNVKHAFSEIILQLLENSIKVYENINKKKNLFFFIHQFFSQSKEVNKKLKLLELFLFKREFDNYYSYDLGFTDVNDFIEFTDEKKVKFLLQNLEGCLVDELISNNNNLTNININNIIPSNSLNFVLNSNSIKENQPLNKTFSILEIKKEAKLLSANDLKRNEVEKEERGNNSLEIGEIRKRNKKKFNFYLKKLNKSFRDNIELNCNKLISREIKLRKKTMTFLKPISNIKSSNKKKNLSKDVMKEEESLHKNCNKKIYLGKLVIEHNISIQFESISQRRITNYIPCVNERLYIIKDYIYLNSKIEYNEPNLSKRLKDDEISLKEKNEFILEKKIRNGFTQPIIPVDYYFNMKNGYNSQKEREFIGMFLGILKLKNVTSTLKKINIGN